MSLRPPLYAMCIALLILPAAAQAAISVPGNYSAIGAAIANASAGDTIYVDSGTYIENVVIDKELKLIGRNTGAGLPTIEVPSGTGIEVAADYAIVQGLRVKGGATGVLVRDCSGVNVMECVVVDCDKGVLVTGARGCAIMNNTVTGNRNTGIYLADSNGCAIYLNEVRGNQYGIALTGSSASNTVYMNALLENSAANGLGNGLWNHWNSSMPLTYGYGGGQFSKYLGNYWDLLGSPDVNGDGLLDTAVMLAENNGDHNPLAGPMPLRPTANFTSDGTTGTVPLPVQFTDMSAGYPVNWLWDFGDGTTSIMQNPPHIYQSPGNYTVSLTVKNVRGEAKLVRSNYIVAASAASPTPGPTETATPTSEPWPTVTPTPHPVETMTPTASPTPKPTSTPGLPIAAACLAIACLAVLKIKGL